MRQLVLDFTLFWNEEAFSKKCLGILLIILSQFLFLLLASYTGSEDHIFGNLGYEIAHFLIFKFLGITSFFLPIGLMYWGYQWFLKKKNNGEIIQNLFLILGCLFTFNMLILNSPFINTRWAGLFPRFFHAIAYFSLGFKINTIHFYPVVLEMFLFSLFAFLVLKKYLNLSVKMVIYELGSFGIQFTLKLKNLVQFLNKLRKDQLRYKNLLLFITKITHFIKSQFSVKRLDWNHLDSDQKNQLSNRLVIKLTEATQPVVKPQSETHLHQHSQVVDLKENDHRHLESQSREVIDLSLYPLFDSDSRSTDSSAENPATNPNLTDNQPTSRPPSKGSSQENFQSGRTPSNFENPKKDNHPTDFPLPSTINFQGRNYEKKDWLADEANLLYSSYSKQFGISKEEIEHTKQKLEETIQQFGITTRVVQVSVGPVVTQYELMIEPGVKITKIIALSDNISLALAATSIRIVAPIPGKAVIGVEVPNKKRKLVTLRDIIAEDLFKKNQLKLPIALGASISGAPTLTDLALTPHLLVAGATGSGKSVGINAMIISLLLKKSPLEVRFIMIDPKMVELNIYNGIPHLLAPVITDHKKAAFSLKWAISEMETRYRLLEKYGVRSIGSYNQRVSQGKGKALGQVGTLPYIVVIIDEFADLMMVAKKEVEDSISRLAAMSRAIGIHLILATQRPSVDVITGVIKANFPSRIAFQVSSKVDSRTIIDSMGAEKLLGKGDLLYQDSSSGSPKRIQGAFLSDAEVVEVVKELKKKGRENYLAELIKEDTEPIPGFEEDPFFNQAIEIALQEKKISASYLQRRLKIGYNRAARLIEMMEQKNMISQADGSKPREVLL